MTFSRATLGQYIPPGYKLALLLIVVLGSTFAIGFVAAYQPLLAIAAALVIPLVLAMVIVPEAPVLVVMFLMYSNAAAIAVQFHGVPFVVGAAVPLLLVIPLANDLIYRRQKLIIHPLLPLIVLFHVIQLLGTLFSQDLDTAAANLVRNLLEGILIYFLLTNAVRKPQTLQRVIWVMLLAGGLVGTLGFYQVVTKTYNNNYGGFAQVSNAAFGTGEETLEGEVKQPRLAGSVGEQNRHAQVMLMLVPLGLFLVWGERSMTLRLLAAALTGLTAISVATTFSRAAALAFGVVLLVMLLMRYIKLYQLALVGLGLAILLTIALPQYTTRILKIQGLIGLISAQEDITEETKADGSLKKRSTEMMTAALVFADHPIIGVGPGMFRYYYMDYAPLVGENVQFGKDRQAHNLYLSIAADHGLFGLLTYMAIIFLTIGGLAQARKRWLHSDPSRHAPRLRQLANIATGFILALVSYLVTGLGLHFGYARFFWMIMALAGSLIYMQRESEINN